MATMTANTENPNKTFTQVLQKHAGRAKERLLQNLGRADKTKDEVFEVYLHNFSRQQHAALKLQKEFKNYLLCIKNMQMASKSLMDTLSEIYEQEWIGHEQIPIKAQALDLLWDDYFRKMNDVLNPINSYIMQFQETRNKVQKRERKLVDYDKSRHNVEALRNSAKKKDDVKLTKAREELEKAKQLYEHINNELHDDLPRLYDSRIPFLVKNLQTLFDAECRFHGENAVVYQFLNETMHKLARDSGHPISGPMIQAPQLSPAPTTPVFPSLPSNQQTPNTRSAPLRNSGGVPSSTGGEVRPYEEIDFKKDAPSGVAATNGGTSSASSPAKSSLGMNGQRPPQPDQGVYDIPAGATTTDLPPGTLYKVRATYKYTAEDVDELNFESGEIIRVIEYDDPEEQEEGWLMGVKETTGEKGLFPANFTRPI